MPSKSQPASAKGPASPELHANAETGAVSFEKGLEQLEQIVRELERGELALEESIALFERGVALGESCRRQLELAESRIEILRDLPPVRDQASSRPAAASLGAAACGEESDEDLSH